MNIKNKHTTKKKTQENDQMVNYKAEVTELDNSSSTTIVESNGGCSVTFKKIYLAIDKGLVGEHPCKITLCSKLKRQQEVNGNCYKGSDMACQGMGGYIPGLYPRRYLWRTVSWFLPAKILCPTIPKLFLSFLK